MLSARSLLVRTAGTIALALLLFVVISLGAAAWFVAIPIARQSADDLATVMILTAESCRETSGKNRPRLRQQLRQDLGFTISEQMPALPEHQVSFPYFMFLTEALERRTGEDIAILKDPNGEQLWVDIPTSDGIVRLGFDRDRMTIRPPTVLLLVIGGGILLTIFTSFFVVRRVIRPLDHLYSAVREVGQGHWPQPLAEDGPEELATLARAFNGMSAQVQALLANRTVLVAGISHDLRTPLTRLGLAVEMLSGDSDPDLVAGIRRDLEDMENLIRQFKELAQGLDEERNEEMEIWGLLEAQAANIERQGNKVRLTGNGPCHYRGNPLALKRILANLLDNAAHYGEGNPIDVDCQCTDKSIYIRICDRGPGIPEEQAQLVFRPFYRLETVRSVRTGGSGLGLAIASQLAKTNGWLIELNPRDGGGTEAKLELPVADRL